MSAINPILVECRRGQAVESTHRGAAVLVTADGQIISRYGYPEQPIFPRSALKFVYALPFLTSGAAARWKCTDLEIVLACASHAGENNQVAAVLGWLRRIGCSENDLQCGIHRPFSRTVMKELIQKGCGPTAVHNNNSGKHAAFLSTARHLGEPIHSYLRYDHPVQCRVRAAIGRICNVDLSGPPVGTERCGMPMSTLPLMAIATGMARLGAADCLDNMDRSAAVRLLSAVRAQPEFLTGPGRLTTVICEITNGRVIVKGGSEGIFAGCVPTERIGFALKIDDGAARAADNALIGLLVQNDLLLKHEVAQLVTKTSTAILDARNRPVGELRWIGGSSPRQHRLEHRFAG